LAANTAEGTVLLLSSKVGTEIDSLENAYYQVFPAVENLQSAQITEDADGRLWAYIVKRIPSTGAEIKSVLPLTRKWFDDTKIAVDLTPWMPYHWWLLHNKNERLSHNQKQIATLKANSLVKIEVLDGKTYLGEAIRLTPYFALKQKKDTLAFAVQDIKNIWFYEPREISFRHRLLAYQISSGAAMTASWLLTGGGIPTAENLAIIFAAGVTVYLVSPPIIDYVLKKFPLEKNLPLTLPQKRAN
jgi:hypothetical protein